MSKRASGMPPFRSELAGLAWPALLKGLAAQLAATLYQFEESQWWTPEETTRAQRPQLLGVLAHAVGTVPYYRRRYNNLGKGEAILEAQRHGRVAEREARLGQCLCVATESTPEHAELVVGLRMTGVQLDRLE